MKKTILISILCFYVISSQLCAQSAIKNTNTTEQKRSITFEDYKLQCTIDEEKISNNGDWYAYGLYNKYRNEYTIFVSSTKTDTNYKFPSARDNKFSANSKWFGCLVVEKGLGMLDLENGNTQWISNVSKFEFSSDDKYLIAHIVPTVLTDAPSLLIMDLTTWKQVSIPGVIEYQINPTLNNLAYIVDTVEYKSVLLRSLEDSPSTIGIVENTLHTYKKLLWSSHGNALTFLQEIPEDSENQKMHKVYYYDIKQNPSKLKCLDPTVNVDFLQGINIIEYNMDISQNGLAVYFNVVSKENLERNKKNSSPDVVQVWDTKDKRIYPEMKRDQMGFGHAEFGPRLTAWWPTKDKTKVLETEELPETLVSVNGKYILSYNPTAYAPHIKNKGDIDLYLTDLETGEHYLFLKQQKFLSTFMSPDGKYIHYFRDQHCWVYDLGKKTHTNVTKGLGLQLYKTEETFQGHEGGFYGSPGWTEGDKELVIYDEYDVWLISPEGKAPQRLTRGRETLVRYRIDTNFQREQISSFQNLIFKTLGTSTIASGYAVWKPKKGLESLVYKDMHVSNLKKANDREAYIYLEESFNTPPRLRYWEKGMSDSKILVESNPQQKHFQWGHSELIRYTGLEGQPLQGALYYPANYKPEEKYPMVVDVYQIKSMRLHHYINPTENLDVGFNRTNYTAEGYIVFCPDIKYKYNDPGISAVQCIEAGVKAVLAKGIVEANHIGLIGHSFGGYETTFTITQTNLFATAVAGAAYTDLVSFYHTVNWDLAKSGALFLEDAQGRFTDSFYQNPEAYLRNSPLHHAANINTPLLLWTGEKDYHVNWNQSIELYSGLRRLGKECTLLIYPNEKHSLHKSENQVDLTRRIKAWFDKYLKPDRTLKKL